MGYINSMPTSESAWTRQAKESENERIDENIFEFNNSCSTTDCTGLIPSAPIRDGALESYEDLYPFLPPHHGIDTGH